MFGRTKLVSFGHGGQRAVAAQAGQGRQQFALHGLRARRGLGKMAGDRLEVALRLRPGLGCVSSGSAQLSRKIVALASAGILRGL